MNSSIVAKTFSVLAVLATTLLAACSSPAIVNRLTADTGYRLAENVPYERKRSLALDVYYPPLAFLLGIGGGIIAPVGAKWLETRFKIDDAVGAVAVHGFSGTFGVLAFGIVAAGYPNGDYPDTNFLAQLIGAVVMAVTGFAPGYGASLALKHFGLLRVPESVEIMGLDLAEVPVSAYPEGMDTPFPGTAARAAGAPAATPAE